MDKKKYPSELNTVLMRIDVGDHVKIKELSQRLNLSMAGVLHRLIEKYESDSINAKSV